MLQEMLFEYNDIEIKSKWIEKVIQTMNIRMLK